MGHSLETSLSYASQARQFIIRLPRYRFSSLGGRILLLLLLLALLHQHHLFFLYRDQLRAKYSPTTFSETPESSLWRTSYADSEFPRTLLDNRHQWRVLGGGWEGKTFTFNGSVIKTFTPGRSPFRNCGLGDLNSRWPTEIPASLAIGGIWTHDDPYQAELGRIHQDASAPTNDASSGFLPVKSHFMAAPSLNSLPEWHLVTPLLPGGNLKTLAKTRRGYKLFREVDFVYRPAFNRLLSTLDSLHGKGFCHDDIKPGNIFVQNDTHWVIGDLGNVRHVSHPYHSSRLWIKDNSQLPDCRANDVLRALKTYFQFVRAASNDPEAFDATLFGKRETLSRLFWWTVGRTSSMSAAELRTRSEVEPPERPSSSSNEIYPSRSSPGMVGRKSALSKAVDEALKTNFSESAARWAAMTWIFGVPVEKC